MYNVTSFLSSQQITPDFAAKRKKEEKKELTSCSVTECHFAGYIYDYKHICMIMGSQTTTLSGKVRIII